MRTPGRAAAIAAWGTGRWRRWGCQSMDTLRRATHPGIRCKDFRVVALFRCWSYYGQIRDMHARVNLAMKDNNAVPHDFAVLADAAATHY